MTKSIEQAPPFPGGSTLAMRVEGEARFSAVFLQRDASDVQPRATHRQSPQKSLSICFHFRDLRVFKTLRRKRAKKFFSAPSFRHVGSCEARGFEGQGARRSRMVGGPSRARAFGQPAAHLPAHSHSDAGGISQVPRRSVPRAHIQFFRSFTAAFPGRSRGRHGRGLGAGEAHGEGSAVVQTWSAEAQLLSFGSCRSSKGVFLPENKYGTKLGSCQ